MPERAQLRRTKGWRMPPDTVKVCRPGPFGNPFTFKAADDAGFTRKGAVSAFEDWLAGNPWACGASATPSGGGARLHPPRYERRERDGTADRQSPR